ncbi:hypothetical protein SAMN04490210_0180 [Pseudomonas sp. bs2935]|nr:hypothetical protein SAMN04490210_0180 [Pseudomonas sp. bs2935]
MPEKGLAQVLKKWDELTAGAWRDHVDLHNLSDDKAANDGLVSSLASETGDLVYVSQHLTSVAIATQRWNIKRLKKYKLEEAVEQWLDGKDLNWRTRTKRHCSKTPFNVLSAEAWVSQFARVNPDYGRRAGAALLAQFQVSGPAEFASYFSDLPEVDQSTYFLGADPHSGDTALIGVLSANIDNDLLHDSRCLPSMRKDAKVRLFCDGSWSGGETKRRIHCMFKACDKKQKSLANTQRLEVRVGFITDIAERLITQELQTLIDGGMVRQGLVRITYPEGHRLTLTGSSSGLKGLAFHDMTLLRYVDEDPTALRRLCKQIGEQVLPKKPLGTNDIASCIAFSHSLPAAMLPLFTIDGVEVVGADGEKFNWKALLRSAHVATGRADDPSHHCQDCPLADRVPAP